MIDAQLPGQWKEWTASFIAASGTQAKILVDKNPPAVMAAVTGETALPGEASVRQRVLTGGQRIIDGTIVSSDTVAKEAILYMGTESTLFANMGAPTITVTNVINRTTGSFISDGYRIGDGIMGFGHATAANDGVVATVTAVTALALTVNGAPFTNETIPAGYRLFRVVQRTRRTIPIGAGNTGPVPPVQLLGGTQEPNAFPPPDTGTGLGPLGVLIVGLAAACSALPVRIDFNAQSAFY